jgi:hypothetical protein
MQKLESGQPGNSYPVLSQTQNNTTLWIGHLLTDPHSRFAGQTFLCPSDGNVNCIQVYSSVVHEPGDVGLTLHEFDVSTGTWGPALSEASNYFQKGDDARWIRFYLKPVSLKKNNSYVFRLQAGNALVGIGEAAANANQPFDFGTEWNGNSKNEKGYFLRYFSLAFKVELCA